MVPEKLISLLKSTTLQSSVLRAIREVVCAERSVFSDHAKTNAKLKFPIHEKTLPISEFKNPNLKQTGPRVFLSSGTTAAEKSRSGFSEEGLLGYELFSRATFAELFGDKRLIVSLVPSVTEWPDSSLAQMIEWIGKDFEVIHEIPRHPEREESLLIIGTSFHFVNLFDSGFRCTLPKESIVIDTGGTKGKSRAVSRNEMDRILCELFSVSTDQLAEEYGMCELASQAYRAPGKSSFQFPFWVQTEIQDVPFISKSHGKGIFVISDHLRIDIPQKIQTEDLAEIDANGFKITGRVPKSVQKGCSLGADVVLPKQQNIEIRSNPEISDSEFSHVIGTVETLLSGKEALELLTAEFSSASIAKQTIVDLQKSLPDSKSAWIKTAQTVAKDLQANQSWLILAPSNHSVATLYHLVFLKALGCKVQIRIPKSLENSLLKLFAMQFADTIIPSDFRLTQNTPRFFDCLLAFGSNETIEQLSALNPPRLQAYGESLGGCAVLASELVSKADNLVRDLLSLRQRGCKSSRFIAIVQDVHSITTTALQDSAAKLFPDLWSSDLIYRKALDYEKNSPQGSKFHDPLQLFTAKTEGEFQIHLQNAPECSAVVTYISPLKSDLLAFCAHMPTLNRLSISSGIQNLFSDFSKQNKIEHLHSPYCELADIGSIQTIVWNGFYEGKRLFQTN